MKGFIVQSGRIAGRKYVNSDGWLRNCQDAKHVVRIKIGEREYLIGAVSDGCSDGDFNEVVSLLLVRFVVNEIVLLLSNGIPIKEIPTYLYPRVIGFLRSLVGLIYFSDPKDMVRFIVDYLLGTLLGFVLDENEGVVFIAAQNDGVLQINDEVTFLDHGNSPSYPAYHLINRQYLAQTASGASVPLGFDTWPLATANLKRLAIATDAFKKEPDLLQQVWGIRKPGGLQKRMNTWSWFEHRFSDDAAIITVECFPDLAGSEVVVT